ncbi:MAG: hypothetical protein N2B06_14325 [Clostridium sp.]|jgi:hypothetical protein|tara:strand:- start:1274 stop:2503 length:1230 start_codon:yes stop_codon:yes gene_type:complete
MSEETKTNEPVKQEGEFKIKKKTPKKLGHLSGNDPVKVDLTKPEATGDITPDLIKVNIPSELIKKEEDNNAIRIGETGEIPENKQTGDLVEVDKQIQEPSAIVEEVSPIQEITDEEVKEVKQEIKEAIRDKEVLGKALPENVEKLVTFMEETGGSLQDYVALNKDYSKLNSSEVLKEYYLKSKPHLELDEIAFLMEDNFKFDEDVDEDREIRKKKLAFKEEVAKAKQYLEGSKSKYYDEIKLRPGVTQEQQQALSFYDQYKAQQEKAQQQHGDFRDRTKKLFNQDFKGFDFNVGEKKFRYGVKNPDKVAETQVDVQNFVSKYLDKDGNMVDPAGYHKAMYAAMNSDKIAHHFYEQGRADGIKNVITNSKNPTSDKPRQAAGEVFIGGMKVKSISGLDSSKLKIRTKKFN